MFGFIKKDDVLTLITNEVELNRKMYERYTDLLNSHKANAGEGECYKRETQRFSEMAEEYFTRYQESKELLKKIQDM